MSVPSKKERRKLFERSQTTKVSPNVLKAAAVVGVVMVTLAMLRWVPMQQEVGFAMDSPAEQQTVEDSGGQADTSNEKQVVVHVAGAVVTPGLYRLPDGSRVDDAVTAAGGFADDACTYSLNLARQLVDGEQVMVPTQQQVDQQSQGTASTSTAPGAVAGGLVNINTATSEQLQELPGIGPSTAQKIIAFRTQNGPFKTIDDIQDVSGIGQSKFATIQSLICV